MFQKACLVSIVALLIAILMNQRSAQMAYAQAGIEYKVVNAEVFLTPDGKESSGGRDVRYFRAQDALNEYGKNGWQLVTAFYDLQSDRSLRPLHLIFIRK
jgi:hypothetical protein